MPEISKIKVRRKQLGRKPAKLLLVRIPDEWTQSFLALKKDLIALTGGKIKLTRAFVLRDGGKLLMRHLRVQIGKAKKGEFHAKKRPELDSIMRFNRR